MKNHLFKSDFKYTTYFFLTTVFGFIAPMIIYFANMFMGPGQGQTFSIQDFLTVLNSVFLFLNIGIAALTFLQYNFKKTLLMFVPFYLQSLITTVIYIFNIQASLAPNSNEYIMEIQTEIMMLILNIAIPFIWLIPVIIIKLCKLSEKFSYIMLSIAYVLLSDGVILAMNIVDILSTGDELATNYVTILSIRAGISIIVSIGAMIGQYFVLKKYLKYRANEDSIIANKKALNK